MAKKKKFKDESPAVKFVTILICIIIVFAIMKCTALQFSPSAQKTEEQVKEEYIQSQKEYNKRRRDSIYNAASPEERKVLDAQEKRRAEYEAKKMERALEAEERKTHKVFNSQWDNSVLQVERYLKKNLNDPDSYESVEWSKANYSKAKRIYIVRHKYRANNEYGAKILFDQIFNLSPEGEILSVRNAGEY